MTNPCVVLLLQKLDLDYFLTIKVFSYFSSCVPMERFTDAEPMVYQPVIPMGQGVEFVLFKFSILTN
jgi:hypothetical protein